MNNTQQPKPDPKGKAIASFVLGIINTGLIILVIMYISLNKAAYENVILGLSLFLVISGIIGLILGIKAFKSSASPLLKGFSMVGIVVCIIGLFLCFWIFSIYIIGAIAYYIFGVGRH